MIHPIQLGGSPRNATLRILRARAEVVLLETLVSWSVTQDMGVFHDFKLVGFFGLFHGKSQSKMDDMENLNLIAG